MDFLQCKARDQSLQNTRPEEPLLGYKALFCVIETLVFKLTNVT